MYILIHNTLRQDFCGAQNVNSADICILKTKVSRRCVDSFPSLREFMKFSYGFQVLVRCPKDFQWLHLPNPLKDF